MAESHNPEQGIAHKYPRSVGAGIALVGSLLCYWMLVQPMQQAEAGDAEIRISLKGAALGVSLVLLGLTYLVIGAPFARFFQPPPEESKVPVYAVSVFMVLVGFGVYLALRSYLFSMGYVFTS